MMAAIYEYTFTRKRIGEIIPSALSKPSLVARFLSSVIGARETEALVVISLDTKNKVIGYTTAYTGNVYATGVRIGELFRDPIRLNATSILLAHNHPSGDPSPSPDDLHLTAQVSEAGKLLDIPLLDHLVVTDDAIYVSMRERGHIK